MKEMNGRIMVEVLSVLATVTEGIKQGRTSEFILDRYMIFLLTPNQNGASRSW